jgi:hypothetical protein
MSLSVCDIGAIFATANIFLHPKSFVTAYVGKGVLLTGRFVHEVSSGVYMGSDIADRIG